jgi:hypothetical protein
VEYVGHMGVMRNEFNILFIKPEENKLLGRPKRRLEDNIKMYLSEIRLEVMDWIYLTTNRD